MVKGTTEKLTEEQIPLVIENILYAKKLARQFYQQRSHFGFDVEDFEGAALFGLCDAARRFEPDKTLHFRTFSYFRIRGAMYDLLRHGGGISKKHFKCFIENRNQTGEGTKPRAEEEGSLPYSFARTAEELSSIIATIEEIDIAVHVSTDSEIPELSYARDLNPEEINTIRATRSYIRKLISQLPTEQRTVIELRYYNGATFDEISANLGGHSRSWVSRTHVRALDNLRGMILSERRV